MTKVEFAQTIKEKYPAYKDRDDIQLADAMIAKYPVYADKITPDKQANENTIPSGFIPMLGGMAKNAIRNAAELPGQAASMVNSVIPGTPESRALGGAISQVATHPVDTALAVGGKAMEALNSPAETFAKLNKSAYENPINMFLNMYGVKGAVEGAASLAKKGLSAITPKSVTSPYASQFNPETAQAGKALGMTEELPSTAQSGSKAVAKIESTVPQMEAKTRAAQIDFENAVDRFKNSTGANKPADVISQKIVEPHANLEESLDKFKSQAFAQLPDAIKSSGVVNTAKTGKVIQEKIGSFRRGFVNLNKSKIDKLATIAEDLAAPQTPAMVKQKIDELDDMVSWATKNNSGMDIALKDIRRALRSELDDSLSTMDDTYAQASKVADTNFKNAIAYKQQKLSKNFDKFINDGNISQAADEMLNPDTAIEDIVSLQNRMGKNKDLLKANTVRQVLDGATKDGKLVGTKLTNILDKWGTKLDTILGTQDAEMLRNIKKVGVGLDRSAGAGLAPSGSIIASLKSGSVKNVLVDILSKMGTNKWLSSPTGQQWLTVGIRPRQVNGTNALMKLIQSMAVMGVAQPKGGK